MTAFEIDIVSKTKPLFRVYAVLLTLHICSKPCFIQFVIYEGLSDGLSGWWWGFGLTTCHIKHTLSDEMYY